jgi:hypothetical protein
LIAETEDTRGFELVVSRSVLAKEIHRIRPVNQVTGWRYVPDAHGMRPCACPVCLRPGQYGAAKIRQRFDEV